MTTKRTTDLPIATLTEVLGHSAAGQTCRAPVSTLQSDTLGITVLTVTEYAAATLSPGVIYSVEPAQVATTGNLPTLSDNRWDGLELTVGTSTPRVYKCVPDGDGGRAWVPARLSDTRSVKDYGAIGDGVTDDTAAIQAALDAASAAGGGEVYLPDQYFVVTATLQIPDGVTLVGRGVGLWDAVFHDRDKTWEGTSLLFKGTGANSHSFYGITSGVDNGGTVTVGGTTAKLLSFMNATSADATRATAKTFSVAIKPKTANGSRHWGLKNLRIVPHDTANGLAEYSDETSTSLGDDWDVGVLLQDAEYVQLENVQVVGYWRMAGLLIATPGLDDYGKGERNRFMDCKFQGFCGVSIRATDLWKVTATTASSLTVRHNAEHYWPTSGTFESTESGTDFTYSGLSYSAPGLTFTGVSPDPTGKTQIRALKRGSGMAGTQFLNCMIHGLDHVSGVAATALGFTDPSKAAEISGFPIRGLQFFNTKFQTDEAVCLHLHEVDDLLMFGCQFETGGTGHMIASPLESSSTATAAAGQSYNVRFYATALSGVTTTGFTPRTLLDDWRQLAPGDGFSADLVLAALSGQDAVVQMASAKNFRVNKSDGSTTVLRITETGNVLIENGGQFSLAGGTGYLNVDASANLQIRNSTTSRLQLFGSSGNWGAGADNSQSWGTSSFRWGNVYGTNFRPGAGTALWTSGAGSPEGSVTATVGSVYAQTDGTAGAVLWVKESGAGNTGWSKPGRAHTASLSTTGYWRDHDTGLIVQWGTVAGGSSVTFPLAFPTAILQIVGTVSHSTVAHIVTTGTLSTTAATLHAWTLAGAASTNTIRWLAVGS